jgi:collagenase-like PrtC family protease
MTVTNAAGVEIWPAWREPRSLARELSLMKYCTLPKEMSSRAGGFRTRGSLLCLLRQCFLQHGRGEAAIRGRCASPAAALHPGWMPGGGRGGEADHLLSTRDTILSSLTPDTWPLVLMPLRSNGRMRGRNVAVVKRLYRRAIDRCLEDAEGFSSLMKRRKRAQAFNRKFTTGTSGTRARDDELWRPAIAGYLGSIVGRQPGPRPPSAGGVLRG